MFSWNTTSILFVNKSSTFIRNWCIEIWTLDHVNALIQFLTNTKKGLVLKVTVHNPDYCCGLIILHIFAIYRQSDQSWIFPWIMQGFFATFLTPWTWKNSAVKETIAIWMNKTNVDSSPCWYQLYVIIELAIFNSKTFFFNTIYLFLISK